MWRSKLGCSRARGVQVADCWEHLKDSSNRHTQTSPRTAYSSSTSMSCSPWTRRFSLAERESCPGCDLSYSILCHPAQDLARTIKFTAGVFWNMNKLDGNIYRCSELYTFPQNTANRCTLELSNRSSNLAASPPHVGVDRERRALIGLATTNGVPGASKGNTGHEDDGSVVHVLESDGKSGGHGEERNGEADPSW